MRKVLHIVRIFLIVLLGSMIFLNLYIIYSQVLLLSDYPTIFGMGHTVIQGNDTAQYESKDVLLTCRQEAYQTGDEIVRIDSDRKITVGTVSEYAVAEGYICKGEQAAVPSKNVRGRVMARLKGAGSFVLWLTGPFGTVVLLMTAVLMIELPRLADNVMERKNKNDEA